MEIRHFVYGKFSSKFPDFGPRVIDNSSTSDELIRKYNEIGNYLAGHLGDIFYSSFPSVNPEVIVKINDQYIYARFFAPFRDERGSSVVNLFHAFVFNDKELQAINYSPWRLRSKFVKAYFPGKIIGADDVSLLDKEDCGRTPYVVKEINIAATMGPPATAAYMAFKPYYVVNSGEAEGVLSQVAVPQRLALFSSGVILNCAVNTLGNLYEKKLHVIFLNNQQNSNIPEYFIKLKPDDLNALDAVVATTAPQPRIVSLREPEATPVPDARVIPEVIKPEGPKYMANLLVSAPSGINFVNENRKISIGFKNDNNFDVIAIVERKDSETKGEFVETRNNIEVRANGTGNYWDSNVANGKIYHYRIIFKVPENIASSSTYVELKPIKTFPVEVDASSIKPVVKLEPKPQINLAWKKSTNEYDVVYEISRTTLHRGRTPEIELIGTENFVWCDDKEVKEGQEYKYRIKVVEQSDQIKSLGVETEVITVGAKIETTTKVSEPPKEAAVVPVISEPTAANPENITAADPAKKGSGKPTVEHESHGFIKNFTSFQKKISIGVLSFLVVAGIVWGVLRKPGRDTPPNPSLKSDSTGSASQHNGGKGKYSVAPNGGLGVRKPIWYSTNIKVENNNVKISDGTNGEIVLEDRSNRSLKASPSLHFLISKENQKTIINIGKAFALGGDTVKLVGSGKFSNFMNSENVMVSDDESVASVVLIKDETTVLSFTPVLKSDPVRKQSSVTFEIASQQVVGIPISPVASPANGHWKSSDPQIAEFNNGKLTFKKAGVTTISYTKDKESKKVQIKVVVPEPKDGTLERRQDEALDAKAKANIGGESSSSSRSITMVKTINATIAEAEKKAKLAATTSTETKYTAAMYCDLKTKVYTFYSDHKQGQDPDVNSEDLKAFYEQFVKDYKGISRIHLKDVTEQLEFDKLKVTIDAFYYKYKSKNIPIGKFLRNFPKVTPCP